MTNTIYRIYDADENLLYVGATTNPARRINNHSKLQPWWGDVATIKLQHFEWWDQMADAEVEAIQTESPKYNHLHADPASWTRKPRTARPGEGTLFQRKSDGIWVGRINIGGRRRQVSSKNRRDAELKLADLRRQAL